MKHSKNVRGGAILKVNKKQNHLTTDILILTMTTDNRRKQGPTANLLHLALSDLLRQRPGNCDTQTTDALKDQELD